MPKLLLLFVFLITTCSFCFSQQYGSFTDSRDSRIYKTVVIGKQEWMTENLNADRFRNGELIPQAKSTEEWEAANKNRRPAWCYYNNDTVNGKKYGKLYNWYAVTDARGLAPRGWHIPSQSEWSALVSDVGQYPGFSIKATYGWNEYRTFDYPEGMSGNGTNQSGFSALPGGCRLYNGEFDAVRVGALWWSSTEKDQSYAFLFSVYNDGKIYQVHNSKLRGLSIRTVKD